MKTKGKKNLAVPITEKLQAELPSTRKVLDFPPGAFARSTNILSSFYWELVDVAIQIFYSRASEMSENELILHVKERLAPLYRMLHDSDWMGILAR